MDIYTLLVMGHVIGTVLGVGGATAIETHLGKALRDGTMSPDERSLLGSDFFMTRVGMALTFVTGFGFIAIYAADGSLDRLMNGMFWAKMAMIVVILINAYLLHKHWVGFYWGSAFSFVSWWGAFMVGLFLSNGLRVFPHNPLLAFASVMAVYAVALVIGAWVLHKVREYRKTPPAPPPQTAIAPVAKVPPATGVQAETQPVLKKTRTKAK